MNKLSQKILGKSIAAYAGLTLLLAGVLLGVLYRTRGNEGIFTSVSSASQSLGLISSPTPIPEQERRRFGLKWTYLEDNDSVGRGKVKYAAVKSLNEVNFDFPYQGPQRATLTLRDHPRFGKDVLLRLSEGQFLCRSEDCGVSVRFDNGEAKYFIASEADDGSPNILLLRDCSSFVSALRGAKTVSLEANFYAQGREVFDFDVEGLEWKDASPPTPTVKPTPKGKSKKPSKAPAKKSPPPAKKE